MSWAIVILLVGLWILSLVKGYSFGGLMHILVVYAGLIALARIIESRRISRSGEPREPQA